MCPPPLGGFVCRLEAHVHAVQACSVHGSHAHGYAEDDPVRRRQCSDAGPGTAEGVWSFSASVMLCVWDAMVVRDPFLQNPVEFVQKLLDIRDKHTTIIEKSFGSDKQFHRVLREAFETFLNTDARCSTFLSLYVDEMMKHGFKGLSEADVDAILDKAVIIFRYLRDKDVFESVYKTHLQKRLLDGRSLSDDIERSMLTKLKVTFGR
jgi:hypothetical protein